MTLDVGSLNQLYDAATPSARAMVDAVLEQDHADQVWGRHVGPALTQADVARLLGVSVQAVSKRRDLLRLVQRDGRVVYPVLQFDGRRPLPGLADVLAALGGSLLPLAITGWLAQTSPVLADRSPVRALRDGDLDLVHSLAHQVAVSVA